MRKEYDRKEHERWEHGRRTVSSQQSQMYEKELSDDKIQFSLLMGKLGQILDGHPHALEPMKTAFTFLTVPDGREPVLRVVQSRSFTEAPTASALLRTLAPIVNILDDKHLETLVKASEVHEAITVFEEYRKAKNLSRQLVSYADNTTKMLYSPPPSSEAAGMGCKEMVVRTEWEGVAVGEVQELGRDISAVLNVPTEGIIAQGLQQSSISIIFWISERLIPFIHSQVIFLNGLRFLREEGISEIKIEDVYLLTTPPAEVRGFSNCVRQLLFCSGCAPPLPTSPLSMPHSQTPSLHASIGACFLEPKTACLTHALCTVMVTVSLQLIHAAPLTVFMSVFSAHLNGLGRLESPLH